MYFKIKISKCYGINWNKYKITKLITYDYFQSIINSAECVIDTISVHHNIIIDHHYFIA